MSRADGKGCVGGFTDGAGPLYFQSIVIPTPNRLLFFSCRWCLIDQGGASSFLYIRLSRSKPRPYHSSPRQKHHVVRLEQSVTDGRTMEMTWLHVDVVLAFENSIPNTQHRFPVVAVVATLVRLHQVCARQADVTSKSDCAAAVATTTLSMRNPRVSARLGRHGYARAVCNCCSGESPWGKSCALPPQRITPCSTGKFSPHFSVDHGIFRRARPPRCYFPASISRSSFPPS